MFFTMLLMALFSALALVQGSAVPARAASIPSVLQGRAVADIPTDVDRRCFYGDGPAFKYIVYARDWGSTGECGKGLLDNLRGYGHWVLNWKCTRVKGPNNERGMEAIFKMWAPYGAKHVEQAFETASAYEYLPQKLGCCEFNVLDPEDYSKFNECLRKAPGQLDPS